MISIQFSLMNCINFTIIFDYLLNYKINLFLLDLFLQEIYPLNTITQL